MSKRFSTKQHDIVDDLITRAEGDFCLICWIEDGVLRRNLPKKKKRIIIEHADNDPNNNTLGVEGNLHHVCASHNQSMIKMKAEAKIKRIRECSVLLYRQRKEQGLETWDDILPGELDYSTASVEVQLGKRYRKKAEPYIKQRLQQGPVSRKALIDATAYEAGCSQQWVANYLSKHCSDHPEAPLIDYEEDGVRMIALKNHIYTDSIISDELQDGIRIIKVREQ